MASNRIKGITIEIDGNTTPLTKALSDVNKSLKSTQDELKDVNKLLKLDPGNTELLAQKQKLLADQSNGLKTKMDQLKDALSKVDKAADPDAYARLQRELAETAAAFDKAEKEAKEFHPALEKVKDMASGVKDVAGKVGSGLATVGKGLGIAAAAATTAATGLAAFASKTAESLDVIDKQSQKIGLTSDAYQELNYVMGLSGADISSMEAGMKTLTTQMTSAADGTAASSEAFKTLGVAVTNTDGSLRSQEDVMWDTLNALQGVENQTEKAALANKLFGKAGTELIPLLNSEQGSIADLRNEANELGIVMSEDMVKSGAELSDQIEKTQASFTALTTELGAALMPVAMELAGFIQSMMPTIQGLIKEITPVIQTLFQQLLPPIMNLISTLLPSIMTLVKALMPILTPVLQILTPFINLISKIVGVLTNALMPIINIVTKALQGVSNAVQTVVGWFKKMDFKWPKIPMPHFAITPKGWKIGDLLKGSFPKLSIDWYAKAMDDGMILDSPTIFGAQNGRLLAGGEAGPEVVVGASSLMQMIRKATGGAGGVNVSVVVNGNVENYDELAETIGQKLQQQMAREARVWA